MTPPISSRGSALANDATLPPYIVKHIERNQSGVTLDPPYVCLAVAENKLMWDLLSEKVNTNRHVPQRAMEYGTKTGGIEFREAIAAFGSTQVWGTPVDADDIVTVAGAGSMIDALASSLGDPGDAFLIPTPTYAAYWFDIEARAGMRAVPAPMPEATNFGLSVDHLDRAWAESEHPVTVLLLTNPSNPLGTIEDPAVIKDVVEWARSKQIHVVVNEIYALSRFGKEAFESAAASLAPADDIHFMWGFSKDFAVSGLRAGVLYSHNEDLKAALAKHAVFSTVSADTQHLLTTMLSDADWLHRYLAAVSHRLRTAHEASESVLAAHGVRAIPAQAGMFHLADMRPLLNESTWAAEQQLWDVMFNEAHVNLTPGEACQLTVPGFMRICFATVPTDVLADALDRALTAAQH